MLPVEHRPPRFGNPGASLSAQHGAGASAACAVHGPNARLGSTGSGVPSGGARHRGPAGGRFARSSGCRGHNGCTAPPAHGSGRTGTSAPQAPHTPRPSRMCWTDASQCATLTWHHLHRHGVGRGTVDKLAGVSGRCRVHLLRQGPSIPGASRVWINPRASCSTAPPGWTPCRASSLANISSNLQVHQHRVKAGIRMSADKSASSPANMRGS